MPRYGTWLKLPGGGVALVHTSRPTKACSICESRLAAYVCDFPTPSRKTRTCDKPLCDQCRVSPEPDIDYCPTHKVGG